MSTNRMLGVDVGTRRVGVAASDPLGLMAMPVETIEVRNVRQGAVRLAELVAHYEAAIVVVGWPLDMKGREGIAVGRVRSFLEGFERALRATGGQVEVVRWDERLTTSAAERSLIKADVSRQRRKEAVDQIAACHILQGYMDRLRIEAERG
ncbi:Holliday junction resolvase RuvX [Lujinxingia litoralis]|uniref:Putative pre-16S rRNA nuclease n=1 Tax=Lujinxingia litoralis TaxID=2211119 RepID=A0A328C844_9DELT|nr:Holliday junction resolvase RuvX [Lujinxingia litoralis]RAL23516.1 Holliday junction resolvase RuvX [Lujinxingia litoralis]